MNALSPFSSRSVEPEIVEFRALIARLGLRKVDVAAGLGMQPSRLSAILWGTAPPTDAQRAEIAAFMSQHLPPVSPAAGRSKGATPPARFLPKLAPRR